MSTGFVTTKDGVDIFYKDWGPKDGPVVTFSHGWPLNSDSWEAQMLFLAERGYRVVAHDRRGHGRSSQPWDGNDMDHYAADAAAVVEHLDLRNAVHIGHSTGGGEVVHYIARHGESHGMADALRRLGHERDPAFEQPARRLGHVRSSTAARTASAVRPTARS